MESLQSTNLCFLPEVSTHNPLFLLLLNSAGIKKIINKLGFKTQIKMLKNYIKMNIAQEVLSLENTVSWGINLQS